MYCPHCGQQQVSSEIRFCSQCGFPLTGVAQLLALGGTLPLAAHEAHKPKLSPKQRGTRQGVMLWLLGMLIVPLLAVLDAPSGLVGFAAITCFVGGLVRLLFALMFQESFAPIVDIAAREQKVAPPYTAPAILNQNARGTAAQLSPRPSAVTDYGGRRMNTGELIAPPPSVTDHTTRLLGEQANDKS